MTLRGKRGSRAMAGAGATSPALPCLALLRVLPCPATPCPTLVLPTPGQGRVTCPSCLSPCTPASST